MTTKCEHPNHGTQSSVIECFIHSVDYYWKGDEPYDGDCPHDGYFWCCNDCILPDHKDWANGRIKGVWQK